MTVTDSFSIALRLGQRNDMKNWISENYPDIKVNFKQSKYSLEPDDVLYSDLFFFFVSLEGNEEDVGVIIKMYKP